MIERVAYLLICAVTLYAILHLQRYRYLSEGCGPFCAFTALAWAVVWEGVDCWVYGPPGFPSSRWVLMPSVMVIFGWSAIDNYLQRRKKAT